MTKVLSQTGLTELIQLSKNEFLPKSGAVEATTVSLATVATSGSYNDLSNKPTIPTVNNATLTIQKNGTNVATFTANASSNVTANISVPTDTGDLTNNAGFITGISSSDVTTALGYTPVNPTSLASVATSGDYDDLTNKPTIPAAQVNSDWNAVSGVAEILNKPTLGTMASESASDYTPTSGLATVATTGAYSDLSGKPTIPTVDQTYSASSTNAQSGTAVAQALAVKANTDLSNLTSQGKNIANWSNNVTNCITEIPQDIKLELNNGTLTLKAGSKVYNGNGLLATTSTDLQATWATTGTAYISVTANGQNLFVCRYPGETVSSLPSPTTSYKLYYNTTDGKCYFDNGSLVEMSFPIAIISATGQISSIDQVFNGFGYIGSTSFVLPDIKGLIPDGRNNDGSLKSIAKTITNVGVITYTEHNPNRIYLIIRSTGLSLNGAYSYIESSNLVYNENNIENSFILASFTNTNGRVTDFSPRSILHALDYNDSSTISGWSMPSGRYIDLTLGASGATYTAPANGWFCLRKVSTAAGQQIRMFCNSICYTVVSGANGNNLEVSIPCVKGKSSAIYYTAGGTTDQFAFVYAEGEQ